MKKSGFMEGAIIATLAIFFSKFLGIIYVIPFYGIVGSQGGALYGYAYNIYNLFLIISSAGIPLAISKLTSEYDALKQKREKEYMFEITKKIIFIFSVVCFLICFVFANPIAKLIIGEVTEGNSVQDIAFVIRCVSFAILVVPLLAIRRGYLQGHGYIGASSFSQVIEQIVRVLVIIFGSFTVLNVFHLSLKTAVGVAVFGATIGALSAYTYLIKKNIKAKRDNKEDTKSLSKAEKKAIIHRIIMYATPFIIINIANSLYQTTDMILLNRGLYTIGFKDTDIETISSIFTTWGSKLNTIITSFATGIAISLIPTLAKNNIKGDTKGINDKFNKILQVFFYIILPLAIFMSIFANSIWQVFYGPSKFGPVIFQFSVIVASIDALYIMICNGLQGLNESKLIYISVITGLLLNLILDVPLMLLFNKLNIYPYYGAITATLIGYLVSLTIPLVALKIKINLNYSNTLKKLPKLFLVYALMIFLSLLYRGIIINVESRIMLIPLIGIIGIILIVLYYFLNKKEIEEMLGKSIINKFRKKRDKNE